MRTILRQKVQELNLGLDKLITALEKYSHDDLNKKPSEDSWSVIQILHHMMLSEKLSIGYCEKKLSFKPSLKKSNLVTKIRAKLVQYYLDSPFKFKAPKALDSSSLPKEGEISDIVIQWKNQRVEMLSFFDNIPNEYLLTEVYKHPFGGRLSLEGMLGFFAAHFDNHRSQIWKTIAKNTPN